MKKPTFLAMLLMGALMWAQPYAMAQQPPAQTQASAPAEIPEPPDDERFEDAKSLYYEDFTMQKISQMYWAISKLDPTNDIHVDNYLFINECDIYREYAHNEFEWKEVREAARQFLIENKKNFPLRFTFMQPLLLKDYSFERGGFEVNDEYKILGTRRFEVGIEDINEDVCGVHYVLDGYPKIVVMDLSRPFSLEFVPASPEVAKKYIDIRSEIFQSLDPSRQNAEMMYKLRDAYMVMNVKIYSYKGIEKANQTSQAAAVFAVLESYEIYGDRDRKMLLFSESFRRRKRVSQMEEDLIEGYQASKSGKAKIEMPMEGMLLGD